MSSGPLAGPGTIDAFDPGPEGFQGPSLEGAEAGRQRVKAVVAAAVGSAVEWYDFFLYGVAAATVFPALFFPSGDPLTGLLSSFGTLFVGFAARPLGAALFGAWGDRLGRKATLVATLLLMGLATVAIGLLPTHASAGMWGAALLVLMRMLQGIGVGGEWGGGVLLAFEWGKSDQRGLLTSAPQFGVALGLMLANGAVAAASWIAGPEGFLVWGWRLPFLASALLIGVGLIIRMGVEEPPTFQALQAKKATSEAPVREVLTQHGGTVALATLVRTAQQASFYLFTVFVLSYAAGKFGGGEGSAYVMAGAAVSMVTMPLWAFLSDRFGRRQVVGAGLVLMALFAFPYFWLLDAGSPALVLGAILLSMAIHDMQYGPQAALLAEAFPAKLRYSGASLGYQFASITAGGPAPLLAVWAWKATGQAWPIALGLVVCCLISGVALYFLPKAPPEAGLDDAAEARGA